MNPIHQKFLDDIKVNPDDDGIRLIYADWLMDNGYEDRGRFIRAQIQGLELDYSLQRHVEKLQWVGYGHSWLWRVNESNLVGAYSWRNYNEENEPSISSSYKVVCKLRGIEFTFHRGFVDEIYTPLRVWMDLASVIYNTYQLKKVGLLIKEPRRRLATLLDEQYVWYDNGPWHQQYEGDYVSRSTIPSCLFDYLPGASGRNRREAWFDSKQQAEDSLGVAMMVYARKEAQRSYEMAMEIEKAARNSKSFIIEDHVGEPEHKGPGMFAVYEAWKSGQGEKS